MLVVALSAGTIAQALSVASAEAEPLAQLGYLRPDATLTSTGALLGAGLAITVAAAVGALPLSRGPMALVQPYAEIAMIAAVIALLDQTIGSLFAPLLLVPAFTAGWRGGLRYGAGAAVVGTVAWLGPLTISRPDEVVDLVGLPIQFSVALGAAGLIGGWVRRLTLANVTASETAYEEAFRLLSALQDVSRDLSLGLDPATLATVLLDDIGQVLPDCQRSVRVRGSDGQLHILAAAGEAPGDEAVDLRLARSVATLSRPEQASEPGAQHEALPLLMGGRVVGVLTLRAAAPIPYELLDQVLDQAHNAAPALATALLFDEVRQLATVDERQRLAREIHDGIAQELASVSYLLDDLAARLPEAAAAEVRGLREHVRRVTGELRLSIFDLRTDVSEEVSLGRALTEYVQRVANQSKLVVQTVTDELGGRLSHGAEIELLRIAQEAVTNVRKHARASTVWVECVVDPPRARLRIADDGTGLRPSRSGAMGLRGMRERADRIGAAIHIGPRAGGGTVVEVELGDWSEGHETRVPAWSGAPSRRELQ